MLVFLQVIFPGVNIRLFFRARSPVIFPAKTSGDIRNPFRLVQLFPVSNLKKKETEKLLKAYYIIIDTEDTSYSAKLHGLYKKDTEPKKKRNKTDVYETKTKFT
jgi:hypothetical protein